MALENSTDLVNKMSQLTLSEQEMLVSFDVKALFTSVPVQESLEIIHQRLINDPTLSSRTKIPAEMVTDLLRICLTTTYFLFDGKIYSQVEGAAMGSPVSPIVANLFMEHFEEKALSTCTARPRLWLRYVDDTMVIIDRDKVEDFHSHINDQHPSIAFTIETEENASIAMLDTRMERQDDGSLSFSVFRKATHTDQYLQFDSHQPLQHKLGVIRTLHHRANKICSEGNKEAEMIHLKKVLAVSGYTKAAWNTATSGSKTRGNQATQRTTTTGYITLPYVGTISDALARTIRPYGIQVHHKPSNTIRSRLVRPKDKVDKLEKANVVYRIECQECSVKYIGETERQLGKRVKEHRRAPSPVALHMQQHQHTFTDEEVSVLHQDAGWRARGIAEAIHIRQEQPVLNRDQGRHTLARAYDPLLLSRDHTTSHLGHVTQHPTACQSTDEGGRMPSENSSN